MIGAALRAASPTLEWCAVARLCSIPRRSLEVHAKSNFKKGDILEVDCTRLAHAGEGVCFVGPEQTVLFCDGALPGQVLTTCVTKVQKTYLKAKKVSVSQDPDEFIEAPCVHASMCGGCMLQQMPYTLQVAAKQDRLQFELTKIAKLSDTDDVLLPAIAAPTTFHYRNRMSFMLASTAEGNALALQQARSNNAVPVQACMLQPDAANKILQQINSALQIHSNLLSAYDPQSQTGFLKRVVLRRGRREAIPTDEITANLDLAKLPDDAKCTELHFLLNFVTNGNGTRAQRDAMGAVAESLCPGNSHALDNFLVTGVTQSVHVHHSMSAPPKHMECLCGHPFVYEIVNGVRYRVSANAFFQVNPEQAQQLFATVVAAAKLKSSDIVLDLYCGTGALALQLAGQCGHVMGVDVVQTAITDSHVNAQLNGTSNVTFDVADLTGRTARDRQMIARLASAEASVIVLDPGRSGLSQIVRAFVMNHKHAHRIIYISCNSEKLSRDLRFFCVDERWRCITVQAVDMFPQTDHLEVVAVIERSPHV